VVEAVIQGEAMSVDDVLRWCEFVQQYDDAIRRELQRWMPNLTDRQRSERLHEMYRELIEQ